MIGDDRDIHGIAPRFSGLVDAMLDLDEGAVPMQVVHLRKRGSYGARCGDTVGQVASMPVGITCPKCRAFLPKSKVLKK